ncbi:drug resistance transporter EmrB/QacA subfamily [Coniochaeta sp. 2T2.1]|nr:drug resistance transporter EmrB/QacA subfamily [Coniochaeta sp. 2T2.1]
MEKTRDGNEKPQPPAVVDAPDGSANEGPTVPAAVQQNVRPASEAEYMSGWRLYMLTAGIWISLFLSTLETTIVSTSLVSIADSLSGCEERNWVVTAYFLTYTGIILRAFQGIGGSGIYSMVLFLAPKLVPMTEYGKYIGIISSVFALASVTGPLVGGAISSNTSWRWVFLLNGPPGFLAILIIATFLPASEVEAGSGIRARLRAKFSNKTLRRVDILGAISLLAASVLLIFALESGGTRYKWTSGTIISTFVLSGLSWIVFIFWETYLERTTSTQEPVFPMGLLKNRQLASMMFTTFFIGFPFVSILFLIPQHAQAVYGMSPVRASLSVLPLLLTSPAATVASGVLTSTFNVPPSYLILIGAVIQAIAVGLAITIPLTGYGISAAQYGFESMMGVGFGLTLSTALTLGQLLVSKEDAGVVMGALTQIRVLGGTVALAICSAILSNHLRDTLNGVLTPTEFHEITESLGVIDRLGPDRGAWVRLAFAEGYRKQFQVLTGFSGAAFLAALFLISRKPLNVRDVAKQRGDAANGSSSSS